MSADFWTLRGRRADRRGQDEGWLGAEHRGLCTPSPNTGGWCPKAPARREGWDAEHVMTRLQSTTGVLPPNPVSDPRQRHRSEGAWSLSP